MDAHARTPKRTRRFVALVAAGALALSACSSTVDESAVSDSSEEADDEISTVATDVESDLGPTADERNTVAVAELFGPSTAALSVRVGGQQMIGGVPAAEAVQQIQQSSGSGFVIDIEGSRFIVTNFHVVEATLEVGTSEQRSDAAITAVFGEDGISATSLVVIGVNPSFDLALLEAVEGDALPDVTPIPIGDSDLVRLGEKTIAIGNPFGLGATVTAGIVSSTERFVTSIGGVDIPMIQTDAAINPGNSGGALLSSSGELIGINTSIFAPGAEAASAGIGFSVPSNFLLESLQNLEGGGVSMLSDTRPSIGAQFGNIGGLPPAVRAEAGLPDSGIAILDLDPNGSGAAAGLRTPEFIDIDGIPIPVNPDIIIALNGERVASAAEVDLEVTFSADIGEAVTLTILRDGEELDVVVDLT